jgi:hypothetical protein
MGNTLRSHEFASNSMKSIYVIFQRIANISVMKRHRALGIEAIVQCYRVSAHVNLLSAVKRR